MAIFIQKIQFRVKATIQDHCSIGSHRFGFCSTSCCDIGSCNIGFRFSLKPFNSCMALLGNMVLLSAVIAIYLWLADSVVIVATMSLRVIVVVAMSMIVTLSFGYKSTSLSCEGMSFGPSIFLELFLVNEGFKKFILIALRMVDNCGFEFLW